MAQKRSTYKTRKAPANQAPALKRSNGNGGKQGAGKGKNANDAHFLEKRSTSQDIAGAILVVIGLALVVLILAPTKAPVAAALYNLFTFAFGIGAILVPLALLIYAVSLFFQGIWEVTWRFALGLFTIVSAALGLITLLGTPTSTNVPSFLTLTNSVFAASHGGAWGGLLAWIFLSAFGAAISLVIFFGFIIVGIVICGFSITNFVQKWAEKTALKKEEKAASSTSGSRFLRFRRGAASEPASFIPVATPRADGLASAKTTKIAAPKTTYLGERKTSVLKRNPKTAEDINYAAFSDEALDGAAQPSAEKTFHPELTQFVEPTGAIASEGTEGTGAFAPAGSSKGASGGAVGGALADGSEGVLPGAQVAGAGVVDPGATGEGAAALVSAGIMGADGASEASKLKPRQGTPRADSFEDAVEKPAKKGVEKEKAAPEDVSLPPMGLLQSNPQSGLSTTNEKDLQKTATRLQNTLEEFGLRARVKGWVSGPLVTTFKIEMGEGERVNKITNLEDDIALALAATSVRIYAPIPGTSLVGIEIPNAKRTNVCLGDVLPYAEGGPLELAVGRDSEGHPHIVDLSKLPHLLVAGTTGSGKSVMLNAAIMSILMRATPDQVRFIMVDPKRVEFTCYTGLPHLYVPVVNEPKQAASALQWAVSEMERRLRIFERAGARDITAYNTLVGKGKLDPETEKMPYFVIVIDELADLMMVAGKEVESSIVRIAQLGRAAGIHLIVATQRPSADVVTGLIKANIDNRVALSVDNGTNSRIIIDQNGAEKLLGNGDMLIKLRGRNTPQRIQGCYVSDPEIEKAVNFISNQTQAEYHDEILTAVYPTGPAAGVAGGQSADEDDPLLWDAAQIVAKSRLGSTSGLQRTLRVGYARAGRIMDMLEAKGVVGPADGSKPREVLVSLEELEEMMNPQEASEEVI